MIVTKRRKIGQKTAYPLTDCAFPNRNNRPAECRQGGTSFSVAGNVAIELHVPEADIRGRPPASAAVVSVPEAPVYKHGNAVARQDDIRRTRQISAMKPIAVTRGEQSRAHRSLRAGVLVADGSHHLGPNGGRNLVIHHRYPSRGQDSPTNNRSSKWTQISAGARRRDGLP